MGAGFSRPFGALGESSCERNKVGLVVSAELLVSGVERAPEAIRVFILPGSRFGGAGGKSGVASFDLRVALDPRCRVELEMRLDLRVHVFEEIGEMLLKHVDEHREFLLSGEILARKMCA